MAFWTSDMRYNSTRTLCYSFLQFVPDLVHFWHYCKTCCKSFVVCHFIKSVEDLVLFLALSWDVPDDLTVCSAQEVPVHIYVQYTISKNSNWVKLSVGQTSLMAIHTAWRMCVF